MKRFAGRETALLTLPLLVLGGVLVIRKTLLSRVEHLANTSVSPAGPMRIKLGVWEDVPPTARDVALGYTKIIRAHVESSGTPHFPVPVYCEQNNFVGNAHGLRLRYLQGSQWESWSGAFGARGIDQNLQIPSSPIENRYIVLKLPLGELPRDVARVRLVGRVEGVQSFVTGKWPARTLPAGYKSYFLSPTRSTVMAVYPPLKINLTLESENQKLPTPLVDHESRLQVTRVEVIREPPCSEGTFSEPGSQVRAYLRWTGSAPAPASNKLTLPQCFVRTKNGMELYTADYESNTGQGYGFADSSRHLEPASFLGGAHASSRTAFAQGSEYLCYWNVPLKPAPLSAGSLRVKLPISMGDGWPVWVNTEIRADWEGHTTSNLKVAGAHFAYRDTGHGRQPTVTVSLRYLGHNHLSVPESQLSSDEWTCMNWMVPSATDTAVYHPQTAGGNELLINWSQRIENKAGRKVDITNGHFYPQFYKGNGPDSFDVVYTLNSASLHQPGPLTFKADIGISGEGFVPVSCPLGVATFLPALIPQARPREPETKLAPTPSRPLSASPLKGAR